MTDFGWTRLAYLLIVLSVLGALVQLGSPAAEPRPLASEPGETRDAGDPVVNAEAEPPDHSVAVPAVGAAPREGPGRPAFARHLRREISGAPPTPPGAGTATFYRPTPPAPPAPPAAPPTTVGAPTTPGATPPSGPVCGDLGAYPAGNRLVFPLPMRYVSSYGDTWGAPRPQGGHEGTDLMVPTGTPEYAITDGTIVPVAGSNGNGWNSLGGYAVMLRAAYSVGPVREGDLFYYAHLRRESVLPLGATVRAGQVVGYAGDTGQGPEGTRGLFPPHLHLGWYDVTGARSYLPSGAVNPYPLLEWLKTDGGVLGGGSKARYCEVTRPGAPTPSKGDGDWPAAKQPGARPDLDPGSKKPTPSPIAERTNHHQPGHPKNKGGHPEVVAADPARQDRSAPKGPPREPAKAAPEPKPRSPEQRVPERETPGKPEPRDGSPAGPPPEATPQRPPGQGPKEDPPAPGPAAEKDPSRERGGSARPEKEPKGKDEDAETRREEEPGRRPPGSQEPGDEKPKDEKPKGSDSETKVPEEQEPDESSAPPEEGVEPGGEGTAPEPETDEGAESTEPEATTPEDTSSASAEATTTE